MHRRCIICGLEPGEHCVYPRNMSEARRWQNLANLSSFDVDTESLWRHGCVCSSHLDADHRGSSTASESSAGAAEAARNPAGVQVSGVKWSSSGSASSRGYTNYSMAVEEMPNQSKRSIKSENQEISKGNRFKNGCCHFRDACSNMLPGNPYGFTPMGQNFANPQAPPNLKTRPNQSPRGNTGCVCAHCKLMRTIATADPPEIKFFPEQRNDKTKDSPDSSGSQQSIKKTQKKVFSKGGPQKPKTCDLTTCPVLKKQRLEESKPQGEDFRSLASSLNQLASQTWRSLRNAKVPMNQQNKRQKPEPELKSQYCQTGINCHLKDQEVQCSKVALQNQSSLPVGRPKSVSASFSYRTANSVTGFSAGYTTNSSNFTNGSDRRNPNAINVLLMNGTRNNDYDDSCCCQTNHRPMAPPPEIWVQESDFAESNERAEFPEIDKPKYRVCRSNNETNVLVLEEGPMDGCSPKDTGNSGTEVAGAQSQGELQLNSKQSRSKEQQNDFVNNWLDCPAADNFTKVLEMQRARINELENLLQQHNLLQQTIQHKVAELQCTDKPNPTEGSKK
ncbi:uncharacterized protein LOC108032161 [Drosophila biarmipes]|uniref:uncharacterized protein LOC108032161 n=1 Tax=Drosophila biarmipes TaxID=125945 RepID=UPI0007E82897|nr:uncharacterized protein LOC108032161 [Drosophila biarmipes]